MNGTLIERDTPGFYFYDYDRKVEWSRAVLGNYTFVCTPQKGNETIIGITYVEVYYLPTSKNGMLT